MCRWVPGSWHSVTPSSLSPQDIQEFKECTWKHVLQLWVHLPTFVLNGLVIAGDGALKTNCISLSTTAMRTKAILPAHYYTELKDQLHAPAAVLQGRALSTYLVGGWMGAMAIVDAETKKYLPLSGTNPSHSACSTVTMLNCHSCQLQAWWKLPTSWLNVTKKFNIGIPVHVNKLLLVKLEVCTINTVTEFVKCKTGHVQLLKCWLPAFTTKLFSCAYCFL